MLSSSSPLVGVDVGSTSVTAVILKKRGKVYGVEAAVSWPLEPGIVVDGEVGDPSRLANVLREMWAAEKLPGKRVRLGVTNQRCIVRLIQLPKIKSKKDLREAVRFEAQDHLPIPIDEAVVDFHPLDFIDTPDGPRQRVVLVAAYRDMVERYADAFRTADLKLERIDLSAFALMRAALSRASSFAGAVDGGAVALCDIGSSHTSVVIAADGVCEFTRLVAHGTTSMTRALADQFGWSMDDAERVRVEAGVMPMGGMESPGDPYTASRQVLQQASDVLAHEVRTTLDFYQHTNSRPVTRVVVSGEGALQRGIEQRLATSMNLPVSILDASVFIDPKSMDRLGVNHAHMAVAIGLCLEDAA